MPMHRKRAMVTLNGWERLWIFCSVLLFFFMLLIGMIIEGEVWDGQNDRLVTVLVFLSIWGVLIGAIYVLGWAVGWIYRGFRKMD